MNLEEANELLYKTVKILLLQSLEGEKEHGEYIQ